MFKPQLLAISIALTGALVTGNSLAQAQENKQFERNQSNRGERRDNRGHNARALQRMDINNDDLISLDEFIGEGTARYSALFTRADKDDDGYVTQEELRPKRPNRKAPAIDSDALKACLAQIDEADTDETDRFATADSNGDGALSQDEFFMMLEQRALAQFSRIDSDGDQQLTKDEIKSSARERNQQRRSIRACMKEQSQAA